MEENLTFTDCGDFCGNRLIVLREDLLPFACGGNKARIAATLIADARVRGADHVVAYGNSRSNLARAVAMLCARDGLRCAVVSPSDDDGSRVETVNERIVRAVGARIVTCRKGEAVSSCVRSVMEDIRLSGGKPYYVFGDCSGHGNERTLVSAYRQVGRALANQKSGGRIAFDRVMLAVGTGSTLVGLTAGLREGGCRTPVVGFTVARSLVRCREGLVPLQESCSLEETLEISEGGLAGGYGRTTTEERDFILGFIRAHAMVLDPVYAGKALWGVSRYLQENRLTGQRILFVHTGSWPLAGQLLEMKGENT